MDYFAVSSWAITVADTVTSSPLMNSFESGMSTVAPFPLSQFLMDLLPADIASLIDIRLACIVFLWILVIIWVLKDSRYRSANVFFSVFSMIIVTIATPLIGLPIYLAIRPLGEKNERKYRSMIMENYELSQLSQDEKAVVQEQEDEEHLMELKRQATLAQKRNKKVLSKRSSSKKIPLSKKSPHTPTTKTIKINKKTV